MEIRCLQADMIQAFTKIPHDAPGNKKQRGYIWALEDSAIEHGIEPTTRYRKSKGDGKSSSRVRKERGDGVVCTRQRSRAAQRAAFKNAKVIELQSPALSSEYQESYFDRDSDSPPERQFPLPPWNSSPLPTLNARFALASAAKTHHPLDSWIDSHSHVLDQSTMSEYSFPQSPDSL